MATDAQVEAMAKELYDADNCRHVPQNDGRIVKMMMSPLTWEQFKKSSPGHANLLRRRAQSIVDAAERHVKTPRLNAAGYSGLFGFRLKAWSRYVRLQRMFR